MSEADQSQRTEADEGYSVTGPYHYPGDLHECFRLNGPNGLVAVVFAYDDLTMAEQRALVMVEALEAAFGKC